MERSFYLTMAVWTMEGWLCLGWCTDEVLLNLPSNAAGEWHQTILPIVPVDYSSLLAQVFLGEWHLNNASRLSQQQREEFYLQFQYKIEKQISSIFSSRFYINKSNCWIFQDRVRSHWMWGFQKRTNTWRWMSSKEKTDMAWKIIQWT